MESWESRQPVGSLWNGGGGGDAFQDFETHELVGNQKRKKDMNFNSSVNSFQNALIHTRGICLKKKKNQIKKVEF